MVGDAGRRGEEDIPGDVAGPGVAALQRNASAAAALLGGDEEELRPRFGSFTVDVHAPRAGGAGGSLMASCHVALNLLSRLANVRYSGPAEILSTLPQALRCRIAGIDGGGEGREAAMSVVFGPSEVDGAPRPLYVGSSGWSAYLSDERPCAWDAAPGNDMGGMLAGALAAGEAFKAMFPEAKSKAAGHLEYDLVTHGRAPQPVENPPIPDLVDLGRIALVGCGAIGQAMCLALRGTRLAGDMALVDGEEIDESNEQRYVLAHEGVRGAGKSDLLMKFLTLPNPLLRIVAAKAPYEDYVTHLDRRFAPETLVVCVDNVTTRVNVQGCLPRVVWNGWTDVAPGSLRYGVSRHVLDGEGACIACYYYPEGGQPSRMRMNSIMTGLPEEEIAGLLAAGAPCTEEIVRRVAAKRGIPEDRLWPNVGRPLGDLLHGPCGVFAMAGRADAGPAPAPHQPMLAGVILASQIVLSRIAAERPGAAPSLIESASDFDAMRLPRHECLIRIKRDKRCFCADPDYVDAYRRKWRNGADRAG